MKTANSFYKNRKKLILNLQENPITPLESENLNESNNLKKMEEEYNTLTSNAYRPQRTVKTAKLSSNNNFFSKTISSFGEKESKHELISKRWKKYENLTPEQIQRKEFLESKKKWICKEDFHRHFGLRSTSIKPTVNVMIYGEPVSSHKYREINPSKWITPNGFI